MIDISFYTNHKNKMLPLFLLLLLLSMVDSKMDCQNLTNQLKCNCRTQCVEGCELVRMQMNGIPGHLDCVNTTHSKPIFIPIDLPYSLFATDRYPEDNLVLATTHYSYNITGSVCPFGCTLNSDNVCMGINLPSGRIAICSASISLNCPTGCLYNTLTNQCTTPLAEVCIPNIVATCPFGCEYNRYINICAPTGIMGYTYPICYRLDQPLCRAGCEYSSILGRCRSITTNKINNNNGKYTACESLILARCDYPFFIPIAERYATDITTLVSCSNNNAIDICYDPQQGILFPERLKYKYIRSIKCAYSNLSCNQHGCREGTCPTVSTACCES